jgi:methionyl-tRNA formyltransferase
MKIALFTGTAYRHLYWANAIMAHFPVALHVKVSRSNNLTDEVSFPAASEDLKRLQRHNNARLRKEKEYFLPLAKKPSRAKQVIRISFDKKTLNSKKVADTLAATRPDIVFIYGTPLFGKPLLDIMPEHTINLHGGLSPYYRGGAGLYWPIYFMEPQYVGYSLIRIDPRIDSGDILHQNRPAIFPDDELHDLGARTIMQAAEDTIKLIPKIERNEISYHKQKSMGKIFYNRDFKPHHLRITDYLMKNGLLREYLDHPDRFPDPPVLVSNL